MASKRFSRLGKILGGAVVDADEIFQLEGRLERFVHFLALVLRQFIRHRCFVRASALSFSTLLAMIPLIVVALSVTSSLLNPQQEAKLAQVVEKIVASVAPPVTIPTNTPAAGFTSPLPAATNAAVENNANNFTNENMGTGALVSASPASNTPAMIPPAVSVNPQNQVAAEIHALVHKASNGKLGSLGLIFLVITAISLLRGIEDTFNDMWGVTRGRSWWLQFMLYYCIITLGPLLLSSALGLAGGTYLQHTRSVLQSSPFLAPLYAHVLPIAILSVTLGLFYLLTPNTKVQLGAAMIGGLCAGVAWHVYNQLSFLLLSRSLNASKFYGGLALVVLVMGGLYILWVIILFGAQIAYAYQNRVAYLQDRLAENVNQRGREFVALRIMTCLGQRFYHGLCPATVPEISAELCVPSRLTQSVLHTLAATRLVSEVAGGEAAFVPARPLEAINAYDILLAMRTGTGQELPMSEAPELAEIYGEFARIEQAERNAAAGVSLLALAIRVPPRAALTEPKPVETEKIAATPPAEKKSEPAPAESAKPAPFPEKTEASEPVAEEAEPPRREPVQPDEHTDFPL
jgi:membrane protein